MRNSSLRLPVVFVFRFLIGGKRAYRCAWVLLLLIGWKQGSAQTASDSSAAPEDLITETQDTIVVSPKAKMKLWDSADLFLSTDTNTRDVRDRISSGYVMSSQETRHIPAAAIRKYQADKTFAYANDPAYWQEEKPKEINFLLWWRIFLFCCGAFFLYGIYRLSRENFSGLFKRKVRPATAAEAVAAEDESLSGEELEKRLASAIAARDYRAAVRYLYLGLIKNLVSRGMIPEGSVSTNRAWAGAFSDQEVAGRFRSLAGAYEYVFYGGFVPDENQFGFLQQRFNEFSQNLPA